MAGLARLGLFMLALATMIIAMHLWATRGPARANPSPQLTIHERYGFTPNTFAAARIKPVRVVYRVKPERSRWCLIQLAYLLVGKGQACAGMYIIRIYLYSL